MAIPFVHAQLEQSYNWNLPRQDLSQTLIAIGAQGEISIIFPSSLTKGLEANSLAGNFSASQALNNIFKDQPLTWRALSSRVVVISEKESEAREFSKVFEPPTIAEIIVVGREITGSRLKRLDYEGSAPVDIITSPELDASGVQTVSEYLKFIPAVSGNSTSTSVSNGGDGTATVTLRGLPASNTLVLINGKRTANSGMGDSVDLNSIPLVAIERIEVLKDGASAIYGSDAIAGVVNIILKDHYDGMAFEQYYGQTSHGDLTTFNTGVVAGKNFGTTDLMLVASYFDQSAIYSRDRNISEDADGRPYGGVNTRSTSNPFTRITVPGSGEVVVLSSAQADPGNPNSYRTATEEDLYNYRQATSSVSPSKRSSIYLSGIHALNSNFTLNLRGGFTESEATVTYAPYPLNTAFETSPIVVGANNPYNPFSIELYDLRRRLIELGPRFQNTVERAARFNGTLEYQSESVHWDVSLNWNETRADWRYTGLVNLERAAEALGDDCVSNADCVALDLFGPPGSISESQIKFIQADTHSEGVSNLYEVTTNLATSFDSVLPAPIGLAIGASAREEAMTMVREKDAHEGSQDPISGGRDVWEAYVETTLPLVQYQPGIYRLELEIANRYSHYDDFGSTNNPKLGVRYRPVKDLLLRSTRSEGFRAPSLVQMLKDESLSYDVLVDPCSFPENVGVLPGCNQLSDSTRRQFATYTTGNLSLQPEQAVSLTLGLVWTPEQWQNLYFSLDWFQIEQEDIIDARAQYIIDQNARSGMFDEYVNRDAEGNLVSVYATNLNVGNLAVEGLDATVRYRLVDTPLGNFIFSINASNLRSYEQQLDAASEKRELSGTFVDHASEGAGALPDWKINAGFSWSKNNWEFNYNVFYVSPLTETIPYIDAERDIKSWTNQSAQLNYLAGKTKNIRASIGVDNIFDKMPPFAASAFNDNFDQRTYELKGRNLYAQLKYHF